MRKKYYKYSKGYASHKVVEVAVGYKHEYVTRVLGAVDGWMPWPAGKIFDPPQPQYWDELSDEELFMVEL